MSERQCRSSKYQYKIIESTYPNENMKYFSNSQSIGSWLNPFEYNEEFFELRDRLLKIVKKTIEEKLTPLQKSIMTLWLEGLTQAEIGAKLNIGQSDVYKSIRGNQTYGKTNKIYGGSFKKLKNILMQNPEVIALLKEIEEHCNEVL